MLEFTENLRSQYDDELANGNIEIIETAFEIPTMPEDCDEDSL